MRKKKGKLEMQKDLIIEKIENIVNSSSDDQIKLNALSFLYNIEIGIELKEERKKLEEESKQSNKDFAKRMQLLTESFAKEE